MEEVRQSKRAEYVAELRSYAKSRGGACFADTYSRGSLVQCAEGHEWLMTINSARKGVWCNRCARAAVAERCRKKDGLEVAMAIAVARGGVCHSTVYVTYSPT